MIKLSTMKRFFDQVDEQGGDVMLDALAGRWDAQPGSVRVLHASSNFTAAFTSGESQRILRCVPAEERTEVALLAELAFVRHLADRGVRVASPVPSLQGNLLELSDSPIGPVFATAWVRLEGRCQDNPGKADPEMLHAWGRSLGLIHAAAVGYAAPGRPDLVTLLQTAGEQLPLANRSAQRAASLLRERMSRWARDPVEYGLLHFDLSLDNLIFGAGEPGIIDFDDCAYGWFGADIAFALRPLFQDRASRVDPSDPRMACFLSGYREVRPIPERTLEHMPHFLAMNHLHHLGSLATSLKAMPGGDAPPWVCQLQGRLRGMCAGFQQELEWYSEAYGLPSAG